MIHHQFRELDNFRQNMSGHSVCVSFGSQGSVIEWLLLPRMSEIYHALGEVIIELEQMRSMDVVRAVADGRLDFGIVREDALPPETKRRRIGAVGYGVFAANKLWKNCDSVAKLMERAPVAELLPGGQFAQRCQEWIDQSKLHPRLVARVSSFTDLARIVRQGDVAAVLPEMSAVDFDPKKFNHEKITALKPRMLTLICNARSLDRVGIHSDAIEQLANILQFTKT